MYDILRYCQFEIQNCKVDINNHERCEYSSLLLNLFFFFAMNYNEYSQYQPPDLFYKKSILQNFVKFIEKYLCQSLFFNKVEMRWVKDTIFLFP